MDCQIDTNRIYTMKGQYLISEDLLLEPSRNLLGLVTAKKKGEDQVLPLALISDFTSFKPRLLALVDPYGQVIQKKVLNLATDEIEEVEDYVDLRQVRKNAILSEQHNAHSA